MGRSMKRESAQACGLLPEFMPWGSCTSLTVMPNGLCVCDTGTCAQASMHVYLQESGMIFILAFWV
jgi:hypothetical protein